MRSLWMLPLFVLGGCEGQICALLGQYVGGYQGDAEGELSADVGEIEGSDDVNVTFVLANDPDDFNGEAKVSCTDGQLVMDLTDIDGLKVGSVDGLLGEGKGSGGWSLLSGLTGTWSYGDE